MKARIGRGGLRVAVLILGSIVLFGFVLLPIRFEGPSMLPTYHEGFNFANRLAYLWRDPARGDVVAIRMAGPSVVYVKRVVGLPGERLEIAAGVVSIDGAPLTEPTVVDRAPWTMSPIVLGRDEYFVIGDNRSMDMGSHEFGKTTRDRILGKLLF